MKKAPVSAAAAGEVKQDEQKKTAAKAEENPIMKYIKSKMPDALKKPKAKLAFDTLMFVGSVFIVVKGGKMIHDTLDKTIPTEQDIIAQMKAEQEMMM